MFKYLNAFIGVLSGFNTMAYSHNKFTCAFVLVNYVSSETRPEEMLVDDSAGALVRQLGDALTEIEVNGHFFGMCSLTLAMYDEDSRGILAATAEAMKVLAAHDGRMFRFMWKKFSGSYLRLMSWRRR